MTIESEMRAIMAGTKTAKACGLPDAPLRPKVAQQPRHELGGLFGDEHTQLDLIDAIRSKS